MQSFVPSIKRLGVAIQWSADITEHTHVSEIKIPASASNNNNYDLQICRYLDRAEKCRTFELATTLHRKEFDLSRDPAELVEGDEEGEDLDGDEGTGEQDHFNPTTFLSRPATNYFVLASRLRDKRPGTVPLPLRTFCVGTTAIHLGYDPSIQRISVDEAAERFALPDLRAALADYLARDRAHHRPVVHTIKGQRCASHTAALPFSEMQMWVKVQFQNLPLHNQDIAPAQTLFASPPNNKWPLGRYDASIINVKAGADWPRSGLNGNISFFPLLLVSL